MAFLTDGYVEQLVMLPGVQPRRMKKKGPVDDAAGILLGGGPAALTERRMIVSSDCYPLAFYCRGRGARRFTSASSSGGRIDHSSCAQQEEESSNNRSNCANDDHRDEIGSDIMIWLLDTASWWYGAPVQDPGEKNGRSCC